MSEKIESHYAEVHRDTMKKIQAEWDKDRIYHKQQRKSVDEGIRSSQISAVIMFLIKKGVIK